MLGGVDAEAVDLIAVDPVAINVDETLDDAGIFGHQIVEPDEIAHRRAFAGEGRIAAIVIIDRVVEPRSEEHTSELQSLMRISYAVFCLKKKIITNQPNYYIIV